MIHCLKFRCVIIFILLTIMLMPAFAEDYLGSLKTEHPRLLMHTEDIDRLKQTATTDTLLAELIEIVQMYADDALQSPVIAYEYDAPGNPRLKRERRAAMFRIFNCGVIYHLTGDTLYANRIREELLSAAGFPDWGPQHFLNIGEISALVGIGYDWIYPFLSQADKDSIRKAIVNFSFKEGEKAYKGQHAESWWVTAKNNWNQVCNGGMVLAALAIAEDEPDWVNYILENALESLPNAMEGYKPDGAWYEGPTYWAYGTTYNALMLDGIRTALQNSFDPATLSGYEELGKSGSFHIHTVGPSNLYFNFGDSKTTLYFSPVLFWLANTFNNDVYAWYERWICSKDIPRMYQGILMDDDTLDRFLGLLIVWYNSQGQQLSYNDLPLDAHFKGETALGAMRSGWTNDALYVGFKGGYNQANHGHLDIGSFVMDWNEVRWAMDLGGDSYDLPNYFDRSKNRWQYFRCNNLGHNTLAIGGHQNYYANVPIERFYSSEDSAHAFIDMTDAYKQHAEYVTREFIMKGRETLVVRDSVIGIHDYKFLRWSLITPTEIELFGNQALLKQDGKSMKVEILGDNDYVFSVLSTDPGDGQQDPNDGTSMLAIELGFNAVDDTMCIAVQFEPEGEIDLSSIANKRKMKEEFMLLSNYPNPFNPLTTITYQLQYSNQVKLIVYNLKGEKVRTLVNEVQQAGLHNINWNGQNDFGQPVSTGIYLSRIQVDNQEKTLKMTLIR